MKGLSKKILYLSAAGIIPAVFNYSFAAGFGLYEQSADRLGTSYAGVTAAAETVSTTFTNSAGLTRFSNHQLSIFGAGIFPEMKLKTDTALTSLGTPVAGKNNEQAAQDAVVPALYVGGPITNRLFYGMAVTVPFGLQTEYGKDMKARYAATKSSVETIDINPNLAYKMTDKVSASVGISAQYIEAKLDRAIDGSALCFSGVFSGAVAQGASASNATAAATAACSAVGLGTPGVAATDGLAKNKADNWGYGANLGFLYEADENTRFGLSYRSAIKHTAKGKIKISLPGVYDTNANLGQIVNTLSLKNQKVKATVTVPENINIGSFKKINDKWDVMADATFVRWSRFSKLSLKYSDGLATNVTEEKFKNTFKLSFGANYHLANWMLRFGVAADKSPVSTKHRTARLPDDNRLWGSAGFRKEFTPNSSIDVGYAHLWVKSPKINESAIATPKLLLKGSYDNQVDILGAQFNFSYA
tara:strand:+ start:8253 stop:9671 length:1419 start_codon:yes stop_codon:yes gene_type:complete